MPVYGWVAFAVLGTGLVILLLGDGSNTLLGVDPAQLGALTASLALLVYLGGGMFGTKKQTANLLQSLLVWAALLGLVVLGYWLFNSFFSS